MMMAGRVAAPLGAACALLAVAGLLGRRPGTKNMATSLSAGGSRTVGAGRIYKVTFMSLNASADGAFLETFGFSGVTDTWHARDASTGDAVGEACATRQTAEALGSVQLHVIDDALFEEGSRGAKAWVDECFNALHGNLGGQTWGGWDDFFAHATAFYYDDVSPLVRAAARAAVPFVGRTYANPRDGKIMYAMFVSLPNAGAIFEFHSSQVDDGLKSKFEVFGPGECAAQHEAREPVAVLNATWQSLYEAKGIAAGAHVPSLFRVSTRTADGENVSAILGRYGANEIAETFGEGNCSVSRVVLRDVAETQTVDLHLVSAPARAAREGAASWCSADEYAAYVAALHGASFSSDGGWDRFIDRHIGLATNATALDAHAAHLDEDGVGFHAHLDVVVGSTAWGSAWTGLSLGGLGVELYAPSDGSYFGDPTSLTPLNFCNATTDCASVEACAEAVVVSTDRQFYSLDD